MHEQFVPGAIWTFPLFGGQFARRAHHLAASRKSETGHQDRASTPPPELEKNSDRFELGVHSEKILDNELIVISPGISKNKDIFKKANCDFELMHCVSTYPMKIEDANLITINQMKEEYNCDVGYSGHENGVVVSVAATMMGISSLERHITLDRSMYGSDQSASLEESGLRELIAIVRKIPKILGNEEKKLFDCEIEVAKKLRYWEK